MNTPLMLHRIHRLQGPRQPSAFSLHDHETEIGKTLQRSPSRQMDDGPHSGRHPDDRSGETLNECIDRLLCFSLGVRALADMGEATEIRKETRVPAEDMETHRNLRF